MPRRPRAASPATIPTNQSGIRPVVPVLDIVLPLESIIAVLRIEFGIPCMPTKMGLGPSSLIKDIAREQNRKNKDEQKAPV